MDNPLRIMIVDDHPMVRLGLKNYLMLDPELLVISEANHGKEALDLLAQLHQSNELPDLVLLDLMMPEMNGIEATKRIARSYPTVKIVMLSSFLEEDQILAAIEAGAVSFILKTVSAEELVLAIKAAYQGKPVMNAEVSSALTKGLRQRSSRESMEVFTPREHEVLLLIADGKSNKEIAELLHIGIKTVKTHVSNLLMKCELEDRTQLAIYAYKNGLKN